MKVTMLVEIVGAGFNLNPGDVYECDDSEATRLISARYAVPYVDDQIERAVKPTIAVETRVRKPRKK